MNSTDHGLQVHLRSDLIMPYKLRTSWPPASLPNVLDRAIKVDQYMYLNTIFRYTLIGSQAPPSASPNLPYVNG